VRKYYYAGAQRIAMRENGTLSYLLADHLGSTSITANSSGAKVAELRYKAWGETRYTYGTTPTSYRYTGQRAESDIGLYYYGARWYDPSLARFAQADVIVPSPGNNAGSPVTLGYSEQVQLTPLTVGFHEMQFISVVGDENREMLENGFWFQRSEEEKSKAKSQWGPPNPQTLSRYSYCLGNPLRYVDPSGHDGWTRLSYAAWGPQTKQQENRCFANQGKAQVAAYIISLIATKIHPPLGIAVGVYSLLATTSFENPCEYAMEGTWGWRGLYYNQQTGEYVFTYQVFDDDGNLIYSDSYQGTEPPEWWTPDETHPPSGTSIQSPPP